MLVPQPKTLIYGDSTVGKSTLLASYVQALATPEKPAYIAFFDPPHKALPYLKIGVPEPIQQLEDTTSYQQILNSKGDCIALLMYFHDRKPELLATTTIPSAYERYQSHINGLDFTQWNFFVLDSLTYFRDSIIALHEFRLNPTTEKGNKQDARQWYGSAARGIIYNILQGLCNEDIAIGVTAHVSNKEDEVRRTIRYGILAPGELSQNMGRGFSEVYYLYCKRNNKGELIRYLNSTIDGDFIAQTTLGVKEIVTNPTYKVIYDSIESYVVSETEINVTEKRKVRNNATVK